MIGILSKGKHFILQKQTKREYCSSIKTKIPVFIAFIKEKYISPF